ncbi:MAG TPA: amidohydrolase [Clostridiales bacterium UBA8960]|nr:amidohydrolase [Clostridiales bacterium UBA8960]
MIDKIKAHIEANKSEILEVSHKVHGMPELGFQEYKTSAYLCDFLERLGYRVECGIGPFETAFKARIGNPDSGVRVAVLAEYDALPNIGHGCGHNIISAVACGVAKGFEYALKTGQIDGELILMGTPAEETGGGKIELLNIGAFEDVDFVMMVHPGSTNMVMRGGTALVELDIVFEGKRAHSSSPENGINALKALIHTFNGIDMLQSEFPLGININGIIKEGGEASNIIPARASGEFIIRGLRLMDLKAVKQKLINVIKASEVLTGAKAVYEFKLPYAERYPNAIMDERFKTIMEAMGETVQYPDPSAKLGSSDIGNVSLFRPSIHPYVKIGDDLRAHTRSFAEASVSVQADEMVITASKAMAELVYSIFTEPDFRAQINEAFKAQVPDYSNFVF